MSGSIEVVAWPPEVLDMSLWVDDSKPAPNGCAVARTYDDAVRLCRRFRYAVLYLDHDLGEARTGLDLLRQLIAENICPPHMVCISWNPVGRKNIEAEWRVFSGATMREGERG